jgi:hypothetical protein
MLVLTVPSVYFLFSEKACSFLCLTKLCSYRYDVAAFLSHRLFETGDPVMATELFLNMIDVATYVSGSSLALKL